MVRDFHFEIESNENFVERYNDEQSGGIEQCFAKLIESDPNCAASRILCTGIELMGTSIPFSTMHSKTIDSLGQIKSSNRYIEYHREALVQWSKGHLAEACHLWEQCLVEYPFDILSIKFASDGYFYTGNRPMTRDCLARVLPIWENSRDRPLKTYLYGMYAFGLGENNMIERAQKEARRGLELNPHDGWATHALAHAFEYCGETKEGISFLEKTENDWKTSDVIKPHIDWHWALYEFEQGNAQCAEDILFEKILSKPTDLIMLDFVDAAALLYRLILADRNTRNGHRLESLKKFLKEHLNDHVLLFNDIHMYFILNYQEQDEDRQEFIRTLKETYEESDFDQSKVYRQVGRFIFQSIEEFKAKNYSKVVDLLYPIRNEIYRIGGSNAQRDVFFLLLVHSAVHSDEKHHRLLAQQLINERSFLKNKTNSKIMENYANILLDR